MFNSQFLSKCQAVIVCPLQGRRKAHRVTHLRNLKSLYPTALSCEKTRRGGKLGQDIENNNSVVTVLRLFSSCLVGRL